MRLAGPAVIQNLNVSSIRDEFSDAKVQPVDFKTGGWVIGISAFRDG